MELLREQLPQPPDLQMKEEQTRDSSTIYLDLEVLFSSPLPLDSLAVDGISAILLVPVTDHSENNLEGRKLIWAHGCKGFMPC